MWQDKMMLSAMSITVTLLIKSALVVGKVQASGTQVPPWLSSEHIDPL